MLNKTETEGCRKILEKLSFPDLVSLVDTITRKQIKVYRVSEAVKAVLEYTSSALDLLRRKKVKREFLFSYLVEEKVVVSPTIDKSGLIRTILKRWGTDVQDFEMVVDFEEDTPVVQLAPDPGNRQPPDNQPQPSTSSEGNVGNQPQQFNIHVNQFVHVTNIHNVTNTAHGMNSGNTAPCGHQIQQSNHTSDRLSNFDSENTGVGQVTSDIQILGEKFAQWFYENLNTHSPGLQRTPGDFGPHHFWDDAYLVLNTCTPDPNTEKFDGPVLVSQRILSFAKDEHLLFNPNLTKDGLYVKSNPHGLVMILVCGTIHRNNECLGVFQQIFGLVKDPRFENNWKIKMTKLEVKAAQPTVIPKLEGNLDKQLMAV